MVHSLLWHCSCPTTNTISLSLMHSHPEIALKEQSGLNMRMIEGRQYGCLHVVFWTPGFPLFRDRLKSLTLKSYLNANSETTPSPPVTQLREEAIWAWCWRDWAVLVVFLAGVRFSKSPTFTGVSHRCDCRVRVMSPVVRCTQLLIHSCYRVHAVGSSASAAAFRKRQKRSFLAVVREDKNHPQILGQGSLWKLA